MPHCLEFDLTADDSQSYEGLKEFRDVFAPRLIKEGYSRPNFNHQSIFSWLYAGRDLSENLIESMIWSVSWDGLNIKRTEVDEYNI